MAHDCKDNLTEQPTRDAGLESLLERLCLGELDPSGWRRLGEAIRGDRDAARRYVETAHYCETLRDETTGAGRDPSPVPALDEDLLSSPDESEPVERADVASRVEGQRRSGLRRSTLSLIPWGIAVSVAFFGGWLLSGSWAPQEPVAAQRALPPRPALALALPDADQSLVRITGLTPVASSDGLLRSLKVGSLLGRGEVFQLTRGAARLEIAGGEALVEGPAELSAIDTHTVFVRRGRVTIHNPGRMTLQTPVATATGEGASFAVVADADYRATLTVLEGEVTAHSSPDRGRGVDRSAYDATAGETLLFQPNSHRGLDVQRSQATDQGLLVAWEQADERLHDYERLVLGDEPLAYWPLYRVRRYRSVLDLTQNGFDGYAIGNWPTELSDVHASQPRGAYFDGESYVECDRKPPVDLRSGFTIEGWARVSGGPEYQSIFTSRWVLASGTDMEQCFGFTLYAGDDDRWQFWTGSGAYGVNWQQLAGAATVERGRWTHVAASFEPDEGQEAETQALRGVVRLFVDGQEIAHGEHALSLVDFEWPARIGAAEFVPKSLTSWLFQGELRDVALYDHVLGAERLLVHAQQGRDAT